MVRIANETVHDGRSVAAIVRWALREMEVDTYVRSIRVAHHTGEHSWQGRWFEGRRHAVIRIGKTFPAKTNVYKRKRDKMPVGPVLADWREALVWGLGHELKHARQHRSGRPRREVETEWAAYRLLQAWLVKHGKEGHVRSSGS